MKLSETCSKYGLTCAFGDKARTVGFCRSCECWTPNRQAVEELKANWRQDPCWDIEDSEGFEEYREELLEFRHQCQEEWIEADIKHREALASKLCPMSFNKSNDDDCSYCCLEKCAWWNKTDECCGILALLTR